MAVHCNQCGFDNPHAMHFCGNCGARIDTTLPIVHTDRVKPQSTQLQHHGYMMGADLAKRLNAAGLDVKGQRRNVTVLFVDLSGFTSLSNEIDQEDLYEFIQQFVQLMSNNVYKYEGIVDKLTGDGLMALFGAPITHENNAELAVRSALDMQQDMQQLSSELYERFGVKTSARIGLHSGAVVVGGIGSDMMMDYTAIGDTVNLANRIEQAAPPGGILISESVYRQVRAFLNCEPATYLNPKGIHEPVQAYRVIDLKEKPGVVRGVEGLHAPMIGRDQELVRLKLVTNRLIESKQGQFVLVTGDAGIGKSRLIAELIEWIDPREIRVITGQSLAYRRTIPYWIIRELLYSYLSLSPNSPNTKVSEFLVHQVAFSLGLQAQRTLPFLEHLLSIPFSDQIGSDLLKHLDPRQLRQQTFLAVRDLLVSEALQKPLVIILEDLHWADEASLELFTFLLKSIPQAPIFFLAISRTIDNELLQNAIDWSSHNLNDRFERITLQNLSLNQSDRLLSLLLSIPDLPEKFREQILERAAGIPFYLEEILRMLIDAGIIKHQDGNWQVIPNIDPSSLGVPRTLQELILTRFDRLDNTHKQILQAAAVIGKNFNMRLLTHILPSIEMDLLKNGLDHLVKRDFILPDKHPQAKNYSFRHILMSDAIYGTILRKDRRRLHEQVGKAIESIHADRLDEQVELLANHYRWSQNYDRAFHYLILAGQKASRNYLNQQAYEHFQAAVDLLEKIDPNNDSVYIALIGMGDALSFQGEYPQARDYFKKAIQTIDAMHMVENAEVKSGLYRKIAKTFERQGDYDQALKILDNAQTSLDASVQPYPIEQAEVWNDLGWIHFRRGNFSDAGDLFLKALHLADEEKAFRVVASVYNRLGGVAYYQGDWEYAAKYLRNSIEIREKIGDVIGLASSSNNLGNLEIEMGEFDSALEDLKRNFDLVTSLGQVEGIAVAYNNLGWLYTLRGELKQAEESLIKALEISMQIGYTSLIREATKNIGELYLVMEDWAQARAALTEVAPAFEELGANDQLLHVYRLLGETALGLGDLHSAQTWSNKLDQVVEKFGDDTLELPTLHWGEVLRFRGMLAMATGDLENSERYLKVSAKIFEKLHSRLYLGRAYFQMGRLATIQKAADPAARYYQMATEIFVAIGAVLDATRAQEALEKLPVESSTQG